jgi:hypothetical protein
MYLDLKYRLTGVLPLVLSNPIALADPLNPICKEIRALRGKSPKKKTDSDLQRVLELEYLASFYLNHEGDHVIPGRMIGGMLLEAGGSPTKFKRGLSLIEDSALVFKGPRTPEALFADTKYRLVELVRNASKQAVITCRPMIPLPWSLEVTISYHPKQLNPDVITSAMCNGGEFHGIGSMRPRYGKFTVEAI